MLLLLLSLSSLAATWQVKEIKTLDTSGVLSPIPGPTVEARALAPGAEQERPLQVKMDLEPDTTVVADRAYVTIVDKDRPERRGVELHPGSVVRLLDDDIEQLAGEVDYVVEGDFGVYTRIFQALVKGTEFYVFVGEDGGGTVAVREGRVEVSDTLGSVLVRRGRVAKVEPGQPPELMSARGPRRERPSKDGGPLGKLPGVGLSLGALAGARLSGDAPGDARDMAGLLGTAAVDLTGTLGLVEISVSGGLDLGSELGLVPMELSVGPRFGPITVSGQVGLAATLAEKASPPTYGADTITPEDLELTVIPSLSGALDLRLPLGGSFQPRVKAELGWTDGPCGTVSVGGSWQLSR